MIEALKSDEIVHKVGGRFKLTALIQKRMIELMDGARPLVERRPGQTDLEVVIEEILQEEPRRFRVHWEDGHESILTPAAGALHVEPKRRTTTAKG